METLTLRSHRKNLVDPDTGKHSNQVNAIPYNTYKSRQKVDPETGQLSNNADAVPYSTYLAHKKVDPLTGEESNLPNAINRSVYRARRKRLSQISKAASQDEVTRLREFHTLTYLKRFPLATSTEAEFKYSEIKQAMQHIEIFVENMNLKRRYTTTAVDPAIATMDFTATVTEDEFWGNYSSTHDVTIETSNADMSLKDRDDSVVTTQETQMETTSESIITQEDVIDFSLDCKVQFSYTQMLEMMGETAPVPSSAQSNTLCEDDDLCQFNARDIENDSAFWENYTVPHFGLALFGIKAPDSPLATQPNNDNISDMLADRDPMLPPLQPAPQHTVFLRQLGLYADVASDSTSQEMALEPMRRHLL